jgi:hypothetical protein
MHTYEKGDKKSCIDLILSTDPTQRVEHDRNTLQGISDHVLVWTKIELLGLKAKDHKHNTNS